MTDLCLTSFLATTAAYLRMSNAALDKVHATDIPGTIGPPQVGPDAMGLVEASQRLAKPA